MAALRAKPIDLGLSSMNRRIRQLFATLAPLAIVLLPSAHGACPPEGARVLSGAFTTAVVDHEPADELAALRPGLRQLTYYTMLAGLNGQTIYHRWFHNGEPEASVELHVGGDRWRTWSTKSIAGASDGRWSVRVELPDGCVLRQADIGTPANAVTPEMAANAGAGIAQPDEPPAPSAEEIDKTLTDARAAIKRSDFDHARAMLQPLAAAVPEGADRYRKVQDALRYELPIARVPVLMNANKLDAAGSLVARIQLYLQAHPGPYEWAQTVNNYDLIIRHRKATGH